MPHSPKSLRQGGKKSFQPTAIALGHGGGIAGPLPHPRLDRFKVNAVRPCFHPSSRLAVLPKGHNHCAQHGKGRNGGSAIRRWTMVN